ncbi:hypothetical protein Tco_0781665 [Tanacetum coccineum]
MMKMTSMMKNESVSEDNEDENESDDDETQSDNEKGSDSEQDNEENESSSESDQHEKDEEVKDDTDEEVKDDDVEEDEFVHTPSKDKDDTKGYDKIEDEKDITQEQVAKDAHVTFTNIAKRSEVPVPSSSRSSDLASKFLNFTDIHLNDAEIVSPLDVHVHHEVPSTHTSTLLTVPTTPTQLLTTETINSPSTLPDFASVLRFNERFNALEKEVAELKKDPLHTQVTTLVDDHLDTRMGATREEFMNFLSASLTKRIKEQVKDQLPQILPNEVSSFALPVIEKMVKESLNKVTLAKVSSQPQSSYEAASTLTEFELKKILINKMNLSKSYLAAPEHRECYDGLIKSYNLDKDFFSSYDVYSLKRSRKDKDTDEGPSTGSDRGLKKRKTSKDAKPTTGPKNKDSTSGSSRGTKSQPKSSGKTVQSEEPTFEVGDSDMPQDQEGNLGDNDDEPRKETAKN